MKRCIAFLLLACFCLLAACDSVDTSSEPAVSDTSSQIADESSADSNESEDVSDETSEAPKTPVRENPETSVISVGKPYKASTTAGESYPDAYGMELTDNLFAPTASADYNEASYSGYNYRGKFFFTIDLGETFDSIYAFRMGYLGTTNAGIRPPNKVTIAVSSDGKKFENVGDMTIPEFVEGQRLEAFLTSENYCVARYVRFTVDHKEGWVFFDELQVIADEEADTDLDVAFAQKIKDAYDALGTIRFEGGKAPDTTLQEVLVSKGSIYKASAETTAKYKDNGKILTDGKMIGEYGKGDKAGYEGGEVVSITVDLGAKRDDLSRFRLLCHSNPTSGIYMPVAVTYAVSDDNENFTDIGRVYGVASGQGAYDFPLALGTCAAGRYVRFTMEATETRLLLVEEAAVYANAEVLDIGNYYSPLTFDKPLGEWDTVSTEVKNLIKGKIQQVYIPSDIVKVTASNLSPEKMPVLTDGKHAIANEIHNGQFFKLQGSSSPWEFIFDLGAIGAVQKFTAEFTHRGDWGVQAPYEVSVYLSMDGKDWYKAGVMDVTPEKDNCIVLASCEMEKAVQTRYVRYAMMTNNWCGISELEAFGTTSTAGVVELEKSGLIKRGEDAKGYFESNAEVLNGASDLVLLYHGVQRGEWTPDMLIPYLAYVDTEGNIKDTMFDSFLFLMTGNFPSGSATTMEFVKSDLEWTLDDLFAEGENILALEEAAGTVKEALGLDDDYKFGFTVSLYRPHPKSAAFGDINGDGKNDDMANYDNRLQALVWYMDAFEARLAQYDFKNIEFISYYWYCEGVYPEYREPELAKATSDIVHQRGYDIFWIPWYCASGFEIWQEFGFDVACMQPSYVFDATIPENRLEKASELFRQYGTGIEIEIGSSAFQDDTLYKRYLEYLAGGVTYGYMKDVVHMYYQEITAYLDAAKSGNPKTRALYDYTYQFIKGTLEVVPKALEKVTATGAKNEVITVTLTENLDGIASFDMLSVSAGTVSIGDDGVLTFYPDADYTGTVTVTYTFNNGLGNSEPCTVEITVE